MLDFILIKGKGCKKNIPEAFEYLKKGCELKHDIGCTNGGIVSITQPEVHGDNKSAVVKQGMKMLETACLEHKNDKACFFLAGVHMGGVEGAVDRNIVEAYKMSLKSCELGNPQACANVSQMHVRGDGVQKNQQLAEVFRKRAIELQKEIKETQQPLTFGQGIPV